MEERGKVKPQNRSKTRTDAYITEYQIDRIACAVAAKLLGLLKEENDPSKIYKDAWERNLNALGNRIAELREAVSKPNETKAIITSGEAIAYVKVKNMGGLRRWMKEYAPNARVAHRRYSKARIDIGLAREAGMIR